MKTRVSIIIPVFNEEEMLPFCLDSLMKLKYPKELLDIIIIDNNSTDGSANIIRRYPVKYLFEEKKGRSAARNRGIREATGDIVAFTDADCVVGKHWISRLVQEFSDTNAGCCGGLTLSFKPVSWLERSFYWFQKYQFASEENDDPGNENYFTEPLFPSCNLAFRRKVFDDVGVFDETFVAGEDTDLVWRANLGGFQIKHVRQAIVLHKHRDRLSQMPEVFCQYMYWQYWLVKKYEKTLGLSFHWPKIAVRAVMNLFRGFFALVRKDENGNFQSYVFKTLFSAGMIVQGFRGFLEIKAGRGKKFQGLSFVPEKILWRWDRNGNIKIIDLGSGSGYHLCDMGATVWELLAKGKERDEIVAILSSKYEYKGEAVEENVQALLNELERENITKCLVRQEAAVQKNNFKLANGEG